ncbi:hypothetical protein K469DRAFT_808346 [Zopfia rhizophila CBS 207.26]|uniref:Uncharacterized protein n=1 Tax=Zopfia rhizophila CBS 207.26 TaxID=1314779 RepID=A0A6A6EJL9_9PEZI|nr:hypothetical protein K469DRAFT_808346 [Zopfia rhizophila CBS 207.26]
MGLTHDSFLECSQYAVDVSNVSSYDSYLYCSSRYSGNNLIDSFYINVTDFSCSCFEYCNCPPFVPDPDIAGTGVLAAFVVSAGLTIIATALHLVLTRTNCPETWNPLDRVCRIPLDCLRKRSSRFASLANSDNHHTLVRCLYDLVLSLSDTQLVVGIAMLSAAVLRLHQDSITVYHLNTVINLAWLSSGVHTLTLLVIRIELIGSIKPAERRENGRDIELVERQENERVVEPTERRENGRDIETVERRGTMRRVKPAIIIRVACMLALATLLLYCSWISGYEKWDERFDCPAKCTIGLRKGGLPLQWMVINFVFILWHYPLNIFGLWFRGRKIWVDRVRYRLIDDKGGKNGKSKRKENGRGGLPRRTEAWSVIIFVFWYIPASEAMDVLVEISWFSLGFYWVFTDRHSMHQEMGEDEKAAENNIRGFGQLVPLFLLLAPILQIFESYAGEFYPTQVLVAL